MNNLSFPSTSRLDSWVSVGVGAALAIARFVLAVVAKDWGLILGGLGLAAFIPSRYFAPLPLFQSLGNTSTRSYLSMPHWAHTLDWLGIALLFASLGVKWLT